MNTTLSTLYTDYGTPVTPKCQQLEGIISEGIETVQSISEIPVVQKALSAVGRLIEKIGFTNDNEVLRQRGQIANYVTQVMGDRDTAFTTLYKGYNLALDDINNVGTKRYYQGVMKRLGEAAVNYIINHAADSSKIFYEDVDPNVVLQRFTEYLEAGNQINHSFWYAFTGKTKPYDIRTGRALTDDSLPKTVNTDNDVIAQAVEGYTIIKDAKGQIVQVRDAVGNIVNPGTPAYEYAANKSNELNKTQASVPTWVMLLGASALIGTLMYMGRETPEQKAKRAN